jgi:general secretion pathway protein D
LMRKIFTSLFLCSVLLSLATSASAQGANATITPTTNANSRAKLDEATITLSFINADIESVASAVAKSTGQTILVDPKVKGTVTLVTNRPLTKARTIDAFSTALRNTGFALVEVNGLYRVVGEADAKLQGNTVTSGATAPTGDQVITRVFRLSYESANNLLPVLRPLVSPNNTINAYPGNNTIVVTDFASNIQRIAKLIETIDAPTTSEVQTIKLQFAIAMDIAVLLNKVLETGGTGADPSLKTMILAEPRSNSLLVRGSSPDRIRQVRILVARLDVPSTNNGNIWVVPLKNAESTKLAITLRAIVAADASLSAMAGVTTTGQTGATQAAMTAPVANVSAATTNAASGSGASTSALTSTSNPTTGGVIQAEPATNSLIITASEPLYRNLRQVIEQLDKRRTQVYIESIIVEVQSTNAAELGIQWQGLIGEGNQNVGFGGTNFTGPSGPGSNIVAFGRDDKGVLTLGNNTNTKSVVPPAAGLNLGVITKFNGTYGMSALLRALQSETGANILSTPNLITLDNEEARIVIGKNIPIITGSYAQTGSATTVTPFQTFSRQDIGLTLRVRPQISETGIVKMQIFQEVSSIQNQDFASGIILNKRNIESNVVVDDGQIVVIGGLMEDSYVDGSSGVPFLKDIPILGALFRYDSKERIKTNLMVFLRPYILRDKDQEADITANRFEFMKARQEQFKQAPMLLPKEDLPKLDDYRNPLVQPGNPPVAPGTNPTAPVLPPAAPSATSPSR